MVSVTVSLGSVVANSLAAQGLPEQGSDGGISLWPLPPVGWGVLEGVPALLVALVSSGMGAGGTGPVLWCGVGGNQL